MNKKYKLVYSTWVQSNDRLVPVANGMHPAVNTWIKFLSKTRQIQVSGRYDRISEMESQNSIFGTIFKHTNLYYYFKNHYSFENIISEDDIQDDDCVYIYPIELDGNNVNHVYTSYVYTIPFTNSKLNGTPYTYNFFNTLSNKMINYLKTGKVKIVFAELTEPSYCEVTLKNIEDYLKELGIPGSSIGFLFGNIRKDFREKNLGIAHQGTAHVTLQQQANIASRYPMLTSSLGYHCDYVRETDLDIRLYRTKKFLSWNRTMNRAHRIAMCHLALKYNLLPDSVFSFLNKIPNFNLVSEVKTLIDGTDEEIANIIETIESMLPYEVDTQHLTPDDRMSFQTNENNKKEIYADTYLHITSETQFDSMSSPFLSEKTFRPILNLQPFIYIGNYQGLLEIRRLGFKTFHPFIDESYDLEREPKKRFELIEKEIKRFADMSIEEMHNWYYSLVDILIYNQRHFLTFINYNPLEDFLNTL